MTIDNATLMTRYENAALDLTFNSIDIKIDRRLPSFTCRFSDAELARIAILYALYQMEPENHDTPFKEIVKKHLISTGSILESEYSEFESQLIAEIAHYVEKTRQALLSLITKNARKEAK